ncbi:MULTISPECIES: SusD/RagB family nutrient-binding outer membrane lipoprotein [Sphingobacterium]|uniref:SusD/RagB family nutrient-binding outer membrane lipoprotein n=1 Tax=Sphingobacterium TaxID=28453 RepID=UPI00257BB26F|nr:MULTISPECIES: SusD/RagB family nutrient-binding outer membrane lipoprotein [Sphingobacterium]
MKKIVYIISVGALILSSCNKWLDINDNPNTANSTVPAADQRLPSILAQFADAYESGGTRAAHITQQLANVYSGSARNYNLSRWFSDASAANWPWQAWYVNTAVNLEPMALAAEKVGAYHYIGVGKIMKAWGFGYIADFYGLAPYKDFDKADNITPSFDDAEYIYSQIIPLLDEAVSDLNKTQGPAAPPLSKGDTYNAGDVNKWIKLAYGLKARFLSHLNKKSTYNPDAILEALEKAAKTAAESTVYQYVDDPNVSSDNTDKAALQYVNTSASTRVTQLYIDYITNNYTGAPSGNNNMLDPRYSLLIPQSQEKDGSFRFTKGVDMSSNIVLSGPASYTYTEKTNSFTNKDSIYIALRESKAANGRVLSTGTWYNHKGSKGLFVTGAEMKFIEAEIRLRKGQKDLALLAYKEGVKIHMELMGIGVSEITKFLNSSSVVQDANKLTMSHVMIQKYIALSYSPEQWVDLRRMDYCTDGNGNYNEQLGVYKGFKRVPHVYTQSYPNPTDWPRRFAMASYELNFNKAQLIKAAPTAELPTYLNEPIWWDKK